MTAVFLINLDRAKERLEFIRKQADRLGFTFERVKAVEGRNAPKWLKLEFANDKRMSDGQVGCYASHLIVASLVVSRELDYAIVLEDDAELSDDFLSATMAAISAAPVGWDYIHLSSNFKKSIIRFAEIGDHTLVRYTENPINTAAYVISNRGARKWLAPAARVRPIDVDTRFAFLKTFGVYPAPVKQSCAFASQIGIGARGHHPKWHPGFLPSLRARLWQIGEVGLASYLIGCSLNVINSIRKRIDGKARVSVISNI